MTTKRAIEQEVSSLSGIKEMIETFEEIAAVRITRTRDQVIKSRLFMDELNGIFQQVKSSSKQYITLLMKRRKIKDQKKLSFLSKNGKTLFVYLSANTGLYGDIVKRTFELFARYVSSEADNVMVIGKIGLKIARERNLNKPTVYFDFPDSNVDETQLKKIASYMIQFERIIVFYARFESILHQTETMLDISGNFEGEQKEAQAKVKFFFEPTVENILTFFEVEIFASIFEQTIRELQLAKLSSRVVGLNSAVDNIEKELTKTIFIRNRIRHSESNKKQLRTFSSMSLWNT